LDTQDLEHFAQGLKQQYNTVKMKSI